MLEEKKQKAKHCIAISLRRLNRVTLSDSLPLKDLKL